MTRDEAAGELGKGRAGGLIGRVNSAAAWSLDEVRLLKSLIDQRLPVPDIAGRLGRSRNAIRQKAEGEGFLRPRHRRVKGAPIDDTEFAG